jgi:hypothetical protein
LNLDSDAALDLGVDWSVAAFAMTVALERHPPGWRRRGAPPGPREHCRGRLAGRPRIGESPRLRLGRALLVRQMALSLALVFAALLFVLSLRGWRRGPGFDTRNLVLFASTRWNGYAPRACCSTGAMVSTGSGGCPGHHATITTHP